MAKDVGFQPDWASPPGETIIDILHEENLSLQEFTERVGYTSKYTSKLLNGRASITPEVAQKLKLVVGGSKIFWMNRESQYREDIARLQYETQERKEWLKKLPLKDMIKFGWINPSSNSTEREADCLRFFGITNMMEWYETYDDLRRVMAFKISSSFYSQPESVIAWLRRGEIESESIECRPWNAQRFKETLIDIKPLTRIKEPQVFIAELQNLFAQCGVAMAIVRTPRRCPASGATYFISPEKALMILSFRYLSDDHFWFSLFHEAGHLLLHGSKSLFLEGVEKDTTQEEVEANNFAVEILIPAEFQSELKMLNAKNWRNIIRFARKIGIAPGIVIGQLQHLGIVRPNQLNKIKTRFKWTTTNLNH